MYRILIAILFVLLTAGFSAAEADETVKDKDQLTVLLIPFDPPFEATWAEEQMPIKKQLDSFNRRWVRRGGR